MVVNLTEKRCLLIKVQLKNIISKKSQKSMKFVYRNMRNSMGSKIEETKLRYAHADYSQGLF